MSSLLKVVVYVPEESSEVMRRVIGEAGGGRVGDYAFASFSVKGVGRFLPLEGAKPAIGEVGKLEEVDEERIEVTCRKEVLAEVIAAIRQAHPYEEPAIDVFELLDY